MFPLIWFILLLAVQENGADPNELPTTKMLKSYKCDHQSDSLTCECKEEQEDKNPDFTLMTCVSNHNDKSTKTVSLNFTFKTTKKCVSSILDKINETLTNLPKTQKPICPEVLKSYKCDHQSESKPCECKDQQVKNSPNCTLTTCVSEHTEESTKSVSLNFTAKTTNECVSSILDKIKETLSNLTKTQEAQNVTNPTESQNTKNCINLTESQNTSVPFLTRIWEMVQKEPLLSLPFLGTGVLIGMLLSSIIACFVSKCHRKKSRNLDGLEMVTTETFSKKEEEEIQDFQDDGIQDQDGAEGGAESGGQLAAETNEPTEQNLYSSVNHTDVAPKETVYSNIDFSAMKERNPTDVEKKQDATETEYAEIKKGETKEGLDNNEDNSEMLGGSDEKQGKRSVLAEEVVGEDVPLYSSVDEIMEEN